MEYRRRERPENGGPALRLTENAREHAFDGKGRAEERQRGMFEADKKQNYRERSVCSSTRESSGEVENAGVVEDEAGVGTAGQRRGSKESLESISVVRRIIGKTSGKKSGMARQWSGNGSKRE